MTTESGDKKEVKKVSISIRTCKGWFKTRGIPTECPQLFVTPYRIIYGKTKSGNDRACWSDVLFALTHKRTGAYLTSSHSPEGLKTLAKMLHEAGIPFHKIRGRKTARRYGKIGKRVMQQFEKKFGIS